MKQVIFIFLLWGLTIQLSGQNIICANDLDSTCEAVKLQICTQWNFGPPAPSFNGYSVTNKLGHLTMNIYYNIPWAACASFSWRTDTINYQLPPNPLSFQVKINGVYNGTVQAINSSSNVPICLFTKIVDLMPNEDIYFFPNPAKDHLRFDGNLSGYRVVEITDVFGKVLISSEVKSSIDISVLSPGIYFIKCDERLKGRFLKID